MLGAWRQEQQTHSQALGVPGTALGTDCVAWVSPLIALGGSAVIMPRSHRYGS